MGLRRVDAATSDRLAAAPGVAHQGVGAVGGEDWLTALAAAAAAAGPATHRVIFADRAAGHAAAPSAATGAAAVVLVATAVDAAACVGCAVALVGAGFGPPAVVVARGDARAVPGAAVTVVLTHFRAATIRVGCGDALPRPRCLTEGAHAAPLAVLGLSAVGLGGGHTPIAAAFTQPAQRADLRRGAVLAAPGHAAAVRVLAAPELGTRLGAAPRELCLGAALSWARGSAATGGGADSG